MKRARPLKSGDIIGIAAPSSPFDKGEFKRGIHIIEKLGFGTRHRKDIFDQNRYLAGTDERRAGELEELFQDPAIAAIMFARGGYGSQRVIPLLDEEIIRKHPKPVVGFSDLTPLLAFLRQSCGLPTFYGPVLTLLGKHKEDITAERLAAALTTEGPLGQIPSGDAQTLRPGTAEGMLVGGCLSLITSSMRTPYELQTEGNILFIEEVGEKIYAIDRMLTQMKNAQMLRGVRGIIVGSVVLHEGEPYDLRSMLAEIFADFEGPVVTDFPAGHTHPFVTLPLGVTVRINSPESGTATVTATQGAFE